MTPSRLRFVLFTHATMLLVGGSVVLVRGPRTHESHPLVSLALGLGVAAIVVTASREALERYAWARAMRTEFRSSLAGTGWLTRAVLACTAGLAEELLFRGALQPWLGIVPTSLLFGALHFVPSRALRLWSPMAFVLGLCLGGVAAWSGSILGPIVAHCLINAVGLHRIAEPRSDDVRHGTPRLVRGIQRSRG